MIGLHRTAGYILGVDPDEEPAPPRAAGRNPPDRRAGTPRIAVQSSSGCNTGPNPNGWREVVQFLKEWVYRVICIDQKPAHGLRPDVDADPHGAEDRDR